ncbi:hypothetical protein B1T45_24125 [Mycobacterium kansasii]|nr:hypothetical protein B1T43_23570 [Mycobacterium kansasii]ARG63828.1 hypothetical protein B1T45_24125 [Mycobacterium kansasii]ARG71472.1 hypothetical protein B1T47_23460 [Mycobacterium kansasii]ARG74012.1 hypothetical protein B1T51_05275 [Mycobacterium kansasii]ARG79435.1 hypothetical protein B1T52_05165 [Mycobacterium kansasii]
MPAPGAAVSRSAWSGRSNRAGPRPAASARPRPPAGPAVRVGSRAAPVVMAVVPVPVVAPAGIPEVARAPPLWDGSRCRLNFRSDGQTAQAETDGQCESRCGYA